MLFWIKYLKGLLQTLNDDVSPNEIAAGVVFGVMIGLIPKGNLLALSLSILIMIFRVNAGMAGAAIVVFSILGHLTDPFCEKFGFWLLSGVPLFKGFWTFLYNTPIIPFTSFNNTLVMGNFAVGLLLALPVFFGMRAFVVTYRTRYRERVMQWKIMKFLKIHEFFDLYHRWVQRP
ncbi:MAG: TIGR03546 family protein [Elusimicrobiota bacterium]|jgi:uncharacterized protein (TIGR03546 family)